MYLFWNLQAQQLQKSHSWQTPLQGYCRGSLTDFIYNFIYTMDNRLNSCTILASARLSSPVKPVGTVSPAVQWRAPVRTLSYWSRTPLLWITSEHIWATNAMGLRIIYWRAKPVCSPGVLIPVTLQVFLHTLNRSKICIGWEVVLCKSPEMHKF